MDVKQPVTYEEQVRLIDKKGFLVDDIPACISFLNQANYYRLSAYFLPFRKEDKTYIPGIPFERVQHIYEFDKLLRSLLFEVIEVIELYLRTQFAYYHGHKYGSLGYLNKHNFSGQHKAAIFNSKIEHCIAENEKTLVVKHHQEKYDGQFPIWVMIEFFSMGMLSYFYKDLTTIDQKALSKSMYNTSPGCLNSWLRCITDLRNRCAHYSRLYFWSFPAMPQIPKKISIHADRTLFTQILTLKFLYPNREKWKSYVVTTLQTFIESYSHSIDLKHMGFPENWEDILRS